MVREHHPDWFAQECREIRTERVLRRIAAALEVDLSDLYPGESDG